MERWSWVIQMGHKCNLKCFYNREMWLKEKTRWCVHGDKYEGDVITSQGMPGATRSWNVQGTDFSCGASDFGLLASILWENKFILFSVTKFVVMCYRKLIYPGRLFVKVQEEPTDSGTCSMNGDVTEHAMLMAQSGIKNFKLSSLHRPG